MPFGLGELPKWYNVKVHGPYDPAIYYGPSKVAVRGTMRLRGLKTTPISWPFVRF